MSALNPNLPGDVVVPLEPNWGHALRFWWAWQWRVWFLLTLLGISAAFLLEAAGFSLRTLNVFWLLLCPLGSVLARIYFMKDVLDKEFIGFRVCIAPTVGPENARRANM